MLPAQPSPPKMKTDFSTMSPSTIIYLLFQPVHAAWCKCFLCKRWFFYLPVNSYNSIIEYQSVTSQKIKFLEIMGLTEIFWKYMTKNAYLPKITILLQFGDEILALSCSNDSIQILVILSWFWPIISHRLTTPCWECLKPGYQHKSLSQLNHSLCLKYVSVTVTDTVTTKIKESSLNTLFTRLLRKHDLCHC